MQDYINAAFPFPNAATTPAQQVIGIDGLSLLLHKNPATIVADRSRAPHRVPPSCEPPGSRTPLWIVEDVMNWLRSYQRPVVLTPEVPAAARSEAIPKPQKKRGRPTKVEQARRAAIAAAEAERGAREAEGRA